MLKRYFAPLFLASMVLTGCQSPPEGKFSPEQIAAMKSYGFNELNGDWSLGLSDTILFDKMTPDCARKVKRRSAPWPLAGGYRPETRPYGWPHR